MADSWPRAVRAGAAFRRRVPVSERKTLLTCGGNGGGVSPLVAFLFSSLLFLFYFYKEKRRGGWIVDLLTVTKELNTVTACFVFRGGVARVAL